MNGQFHWVFFLTPWVYDCVKIIFLLIAHSREQRISTFNIARRAAGIDVTLIIALLPVLSYYSFRFRNFLGFYKYFCWYLQAEIVLVAISLIFLLVCSSFLNGWVSEYSLPTVLISFISWICISSDCSRNTRNRLGRISWFPTRFEYLPSWSCITRPNFLVLIVLFLVVFSEREHKSVIQGVLNFLHLITSLTKIFSSRGSYLTNSVIVWIQYRNSSHIACCSVMFNLLSKSSINFPLLMRKRKTFRNFWT